MKITITFLMPSHSKHPVGGFKVVYEYANRFVKDGYIVNIVYPSTVFSNPKWSLEKIKGILRYTYYKISGRYNPYHWFDLDRSINTLWVPFLSQKHMPKTDVFIATSAETAECLARFEHSGNKIYFIQGYEVWWNGEEHFLNTLSLSLQKIVISPHLLRIVEARGQKAELLLNGFDFNYFKQNIDIKVRNKYHLAMLFHLSPAKGCEDGLKALDIVKSIFPLLKVSFFGYPKKPDNLPQWIDYYRSPDKQLLNQIYNEAAIFIGTSHSEGWGLTIGEAMICGSAVACTNIDGYSIIAEHESTALLCDPGDFHAMAKNIIRLINDDNLRYSIALNGNKSIQKYKWDDSYISFKKIVKTK